MVAASGKSTDPAMRAWARYVSMTSQTAARLARSRATPRPGRRTL